MILKKIFFVIVWANISNMLMAQTQFTDITEAAGIDHQFRVYEGMFGGGICVFDLNKDGYEDLYITSGTNDDVLYLNQRNGTFKNIFESAGLQEVKKFATQGVAGADVNRDGWVDLFITTITRRDNVPTIPRAKNLLFLNNGDNTFTDATKKYNLNHLNSFSTGASFGDFNADGYPDLYIGNYFQNYEGELTEIKDATIVNANQTAKGYLLINRGGRYFDNVYEYYRLNHKGFGFGGVFTDYDNDGDQDLLINHDFGYKARPSYFLRNDYPSRFFTYVEKEKAMDLKINAMGSAVGDYDNDGWMDYYITNIKFNPFMVNQGPDKPFVNKANMLGMNSLSISWGANFADFDHDGDLDLFIANGDLNPNCHPMRNNYLQNNYNTFTDIARSVGLQDYGIGRGSVIFDIENDGDMDLLVVNQKPVKPYPIPSKTILYRNDSTTGNWLKVALQGTQAETHGIGSRVEVFIGKRHMIREIDGGGSSHLSQNSTIAHFGLGTATTVDSIVVRWTGGKRQVVKAQNANQSLTITEPIVKKQRSWLTFGILGLLILGGVFFWIRQRMAL